MKCTRSLVALVVVTGLLVGVAGVAGANHTPERGQACENAQNVATLPVDERAKIAAAEGVERARGSACGEPHPEK